MNAKFNIETQRLLMEASPGQLFTFFGPDLTECVCAIRSRGTPDGVQPDLPPRDRLNPDAMVPVVVMACRVEPGEPEFYPAGYQTELSGAAPIAFLRPAKDLEFEPVEACAKPRIRCAQGMPKLDMSNVHEGLAALHRLSEWPKGFAYLHPYQYTFALGGLTYFTGPSYLRRR